MFKNKPLLAPLKNILTFLLMLVLSLALFSPVYAEDGEGSKVDDSEYYELSPPFVVNLQSNKKRMRFLQVRIQVLGSLKAIEEVKTHNAPLRDVIITALSAQTRDSINTPKKKKTLQDKVQGDAENVLKDLTGKKQITGLYFTNFVVQ